MGEIVATNDKMFSHRASELGIYDLAEKGFLKEIQDKLHKVTGMAFAVVDYRGEMVTEPSGFTEFCICRRQCGCHKKNCCLSDAFGGATAAIMNEPYVYRCPSGLVDAAIPIVVGQQYIGAFLGGQVRCGDEDGLDDFAEKIKDGPDWKNDRKLCEKYAKIPVLSMEHIRQAVDLAFLLIRQMCEKEDALFEKKGYERKAVHLMAENRRFKEKEKQMEEMVLSQKKGQADSHLILNMLNAVSGLACVEDAPQTENMAELLARMVKYQLKPEETPVSLEEELDYVECYLKMQKLRFEDKMDYEIVREEDLGGQMIFPKTLLPFVESAVSNGILARRGKGSIRLFCYTEKADCIITVEDEGSGFTDQQLSRIYGPFQENGENVRVSSDIYMARRKLVGKYGSKYDIKMTSNGGEGTKVMVRIPRSIKRIRCYV